MSEQEWGVAIGAICVAISLTPSRVSWLNWLEPYQDLLVFGGSGLIAVGLLDLCNHD